jgi:hypothetical protein
LINPSLELKRALRKKLDTRNNLPVKIVPGNQKPKVVGYRCHFTNKRGDIVHYPNAYRKAKGKPIYNHSTVRIEVGAKWIWKSKKFEKFKHEVAEMVFRVFA